jgi:hypothetical protein
MPERGSKRLLVYFAPGLLFGVAVLGWGALYMRAPRHTVAQLRSDWIEPNEPEGKFHRWWSNGESIIGETEVWPHHHLRANAFLRSRQSYNGGIEVRLRLRFLRGRYLGCYLCYDPATGNGYLLTTGHPAGEFANEACVSVVHNHETTTLGRQPVSIDAQREHEIVFRRQREQLTILVDGREIISETDSSFSSGLVQLHLHNSKVAINELTVQGL